MKIKFKKGKQANLTNLPIDNGSLIITTDTNRIYLDDSSSRKEIANEDISTISISHDGALTSGWKRVALLYGSRYGSCWLVTLSSSYNSPHDFSGSFLLVLGYDNAQISILGNEANDQFNGIRLCKESKNGSKYYLEFNSIGSTYNNRPKCTFKNLDGDRASSYCTTFDFTSGSTGSGVIISKTISANSSNVFKSGDNAIGDSTTPVYVDKDGKIVACTAYSSASVSSATSAATATKATQDGSGNVIISTYLKLTGGTLCNVGSSTDDSPLSIKPRGSDSSWIKFLNKSGSITGYLGVNGSKIPAFYDDSLSKNKESTLLGGRLLWENGSPTSSFASQDITVPDMSIYRFVVIISRNNAANNESTTIWIPTKKVTGVDNYQAISVSMDSYSLWRWYKLVSNTKINASVGHIIAVQNGIGNYSADDNTRHVPYKIYGIY